MFGFAWQSVFLGPEDPAMCQRIFDQVRADANWERSAVESEELAASVLLAFQHGFTDEAALLAEICSQRDGLWKRTG